METLKRAEDCALRNSVLDFTLHPIIYHPTPEKIAEIPQMAEQGYFSIKIFTLFQFDRRVKDFIRAIDAAREHDMITMMHCEDQPLNGFLARRLISEGKSTIQYYNDSRPDYAEAIATARAVAIGRATGANIYVVHLSSKAALDVTRQNAAVGQRVYVETRPIYLHLDERIYEEENAAKYTGWPPLRDPEDVEALWHGINAGNIHTVCSDHAPWFLHQKLDPERDVSNFLPGMANLETMLPMLYDDGVRAGRITANKWVDLVATNPAKLFGMFPQKGTIAVGSDADIVVWDTERTRIIRGEEMASNAGFDIYEGKEVKGWPEYTISRGEVIVDKGELVGTRGRGLRVIRGPHRPL
jgi:dihydropyrimidinase